jgi:rhamnogalacturonyl hydrolase YesR
MAAPNGLFWDHIDGDGGVDTTVWSYNQGSVIGALVLLAQETGDPTAIAQAEGIADRTLATFAGRWLTAEPPEFSAIFFRNLLALAAVDHRADYVAAAQAFADVVWTQNRDPRTGLVSFGGPTRLLDQAAIVQVYADLATAGR